MLEAELAYCAGIIDGEGCIRIKRIAWARYRSDRQTPGYHASIQVKMVERAPLDLLASIFGGSVRIERRQEPNRRPLFSWSITDAKAEAACVILIPMLLVKRRQAELIVKLRAMQKEGRKHRTKITGYREFPNSHGTIRMVANRSYSDEFIASLETLYLESRRLNGVGDNAAVD